MPYVLAKSDLFAFLEKLGLGCFFDLGFGLVAGYVQKSREITETHGKV